MSNELMSNHLPESIRREFLEAMLAACKPTGTFPMNKLTTQVFRTIGKPWRSYASTEGEKLGEWLDRNFPELHREGDNITPVKKNESQPQPQPLPLPVIPVDAVTMEKIQKAVDECFDESSVVILAALGAKLRDAGIDRTAYTTLTLGNWILSLFPDLEQNKNNSQQLLRRDDSGTYPESAQNLSEIDLDEDLRQMNILVDMGSWSNNIRSLKKLTGCTGNAVRTWSGIVAQKISELFLGHGNLVCRETDEDGLRLAFYAGVDSPDGMPVYCVLIRNRQNKTENLQPLMLDRFCCPRETDPETTLEGWLKQEIDALELQQPDAHQADILRLEEQCNQLELQRQMLLGRMGEILRLLEQTADVPAGAEPDLAAYRSTWQTVRDLRLSVEVPEELVSTQEILNWCAEQNAFAICLNQIEQAFAQTRECLATILAEHQITNGNLTADGEALCRACEEYGMDLHTEDIRNVALPYRMLLEVMEPMTFQQNIMKLLTVTGELDSHFGFSTILLFGLKERNPERYQQFRRSLTVVDAQIGALESLCNPKAQGVKQEKVFPTLESLLQAFKDKKIHVLWNAGGAQNELENLILEDRLPEAESFVMDSYAMENAGYGQEDRQEILSRLMDDNVQNLPEGHTVFNAALRLDRILGSENETARRYFHMALFIEPEKAAMELLRVYRQSGDDERFRELWALMGTAAQYHLDNEIYHIGQIWEDSPEQFQNYVAKHIYLAYLPECRDGMTLRWPEAVAPIPEQYFMQYEPNVLEQLLIEDRREDVQRLLEDREQLTALGYDDEQITQISQAAISDRYPVGTAPYPTGTRLYLFQRNLHNLAERYLWRGLAMGQSAGMANALIRLLAQEKRWSECNRLYNCYAGESNINADSRQAYLMSLLCIAPIRAQQFIRTNLQDFLALVQQNPEALEMVDHHRNSSNETFREFYRSAWQLTELLEEPFPRSVMLHDRSLRDMVTQPDMLLELDLDDKQIEAARTLYQSGNYPKEADAVSVAKRVYAFLGTYHGIAEKLCRFAAPAEGAVELLWEICAANADTQEQYLLFRDYPMLCQIHPEEYSQYLFDTNQYEAYLEQVRETEHSQLRLLQQAIAQLELDAQAEWNPATLEEPVTALQIARIARLASLLVQAERTEDFAKLLLPNFQVLLADCTPSDLRNIMTAGGALDDENARKVQALALEQQMPGVALYYYNTMNVGDLAQEADAYYNELLSHEEDAVEQQLAQMEILAKLYPGRYEELSSRIYQLRVCDLLETSSGSKEAADKLITLLERCTLEAEEVRILIRSISDSSLGGKHQVIAGVLKLTDRDELHADGLIYLHNVLYTASTKAVPDEVLCENLCQRYLDAMNQGYFPDFLAPDAEVLCQRIIRSYDHLYLAVLCLYRIELLLNRQNRAEFVLRSLMMRPATELGNKLYALAEAAAESCWAGNIPGVLDLFRKALSQQMPEELLSYCQFCSIFSEVGEEDLFLMREQIDRLHKQKRNDRLTATCTEQEGESFVKVLLSDPKNPNYWLTAAILPGLTPEEQGKVLYICCTWNPNLWQECATHCVNFNLDRLLLPSLRKWSATPSPGPKACRAYLAEAVSKDPKFFEHWTAPAEIRQLLDLLEELCQDISSDLQNLNTTVGHAALTAVSLIAVAMPSDEALGLLEQYLFDALINRYSEVGVATAIRLLLDNRPDYAGHLLENLSRSGAPIACSLLVEQLGQMDAQALCDWAEVPNNKLLMQLLLPDGSRPNAQNIQAFVQDMIRSQRVSDGLTVLNKLLEIFPGDYACCDALFILCKCGLENPIPMLHKSLCGLISGSTTGSSYFRRDFVWNARLLAGVNAIIQAKHLEREVSAVYPDGRFNQSAGDYCRMTHPEAGESVFETIDRTQWELTNDLENLAPEVLEYKCEAILCWITGDWTAFLYHNWMRKADAWDVSGIAEYLRMQPDPRPSQMDSIGFSRSLLRVLAQLPETERTPFLEWVRLALVGSGAVKTQDTKAWNLHGKLRHVYMAMDLEEKKISENVGDLSLEFPMEEYSLFPLLYKEKVERCFGTDPELLHNRLWLLGVVLDYPVPIQYQYANVAQMAFRKGDDETAGAFYEVLVRLLKRGLCYTERITDKQFHSFNALYEAYMRVSKLLAGDEAIAAYVARAEFNPWSCLNMTVALLCTQRANLAMQMSASFDEYNRRLSRTLIKAVNPNVPDLEKLDALDELPDGVGKAYLTYIMSQGIKDQNDVFRALFFEEPGISWQLRQKSQELARACAALGGKNDFIFNKKNNSFYPAHTLVSTFTQIHPNAYRQLPVEDMNVDAPEEEIRTEAAVMQNTPAGEGSSKFRAPLPAFTGGLEPSDEGVSQEAMIEEHNSLQRFPRYYQERLKLSESIYCGTLGGATAPEESLAALIDFGLDYYDYHGDLNSAEETALANQGILELVVYVDSELQAMPAVRNRRLENARRELEDAVENRIFYKLIDGEQASIESLVAVFAKDRKAFGLMQQMVKQDSVRKEAVDLICSALDGLADCYSKHSDNSNQMQSSLNESKKMIGRIRYSPWQSLRTKLLNLIQTEINHLLRRPRLSLEILNQEHNSEDGYLYGQIENNGLESAQDIIVEVTFDDCSSDRYRLSSLAPKERSCFKILYAAPEETEKLHYILNWSYAFQGQTYHQSPVEDYLTICEEPDPNYPVGVYKDQTIAAFYADEDGKIVNPHFFGRESETEQLRNLFRDGRFPGYNNAIIYGIRRAGKTTLLNYVLKYVQVYCDDAIIVYLDCLKDMGTRLVQSLFIDRVLDKVQGAYPEYKSAEGWLQLVEAWKLPEGAASDRKPEELERFYQELKQVTGKGLILLLDEIDNFFSSVEQQTSLDSHLFQVLSNMLCSATSSECIKFIFCGSKYLLRYQTGDGGLSQLFQRFGSNIIEVGLIPKKAMTEMLRKPYEDYPEVQITDQAIDWIWDYTQGLVWHVKLLGNEVMQYVRKDYRSIVYPADVQEKIWSVIKRPYCEQFYDGINEQEQDKLERLVIDAMQSLASTRSTVVPRNKLLQLLETKNVSENQADRALRNLDKLKLVKYDPHTKGYKFRVDLYRLYFRCQDQYPSEFRKVSELEPTFTQI